MPSVANQISREVERRDAIWIELHQAFESLASSIPDWVHPAGADTLFHEINNALAGIEDWDLSEVKHWHGVIVDKIADERRYHLEDLPGEDPDPEWARRLIELGERLEAETPNLASRRGSIRRALNLAKRSPRADMSALRPPGPGSMWCSTHRCALRIIYPSMNEREHDLDFRTEPVRVSLTAMRDAIEAIRAIINPLLRQVTTHHIEIVELNERLAKLEGRDDGGAGKAQAD
jgi:hypothetical protein